MTTFIVIPSLRHSTEVSRSDGGGYPAGHKRLKPKHPPDFDEGYFDRGHEPVLQTQSARFITFTVIENICRKEIGRILEE